MKYRYTYKAYPRYPEATEISRDREEKRPYSFMLAIAVIIAGFIILIGDGDFLGLLLSLAGGGWLFYIIKYYDKVTDKKVARDIKARDDMKKNGRGVL